MLMMIMMMMMLPLLQVSCLAQAHDDDDYPALYCIEYHCILLNTEQLKIYCMKTLGFLKL